MARRAIQLYLERGEVWEWEPEREAPELKRPGAAFLTLTEKGDLRGCMGLTEPVLPLYRAVIRYAIATACADPRFPPVAAGGAGPGEDRDLGPKPLAGDPESVGDPGGKGWDCDREGGSTGLLLPQVALEYHWDRKTFLEQTCRKAGLPADAWRQGAKIRTFSAEIFHEAR